MYLHRILTVSVRGQVPKFLQTDIKRHGVPAFPAKYFKRPECGLRIRALLSDSFHDEPLVLALATGRVERVRLSLAIAARRTDGMRDLGLAYILLEPTGKNDPVVTRINKVEIEKIIPLGEQVSYEPFIDPPAEPTAPPLLPANRPTVIRAPKKRVEIDDGFLTFVYRNLIRDHPGRNWDYASFVTAHPGIVGRFRAGNLTKTELETALSQSFGWPVEPKKPTGPEPTGEGSAPISAHTAEVYKMMDRYDVGYQAAQTLVVKFPDLTARDQAARIQHGWGVTARKPR
ncbi:MAG: hypothetical protein JW873_00845 [Candidatus Saganbacteria bacterium]|nr:hypothetical protein [Candidatus Saganbacteria bacterium]